MNNQHEIFLSHSGLDNELAISLAHESSTNSLSESSIHPIRKFDLRTFSSTPLLVRSPRSGIFAVVSERQFSYILRLS